MLKPALQSFESVPSMAIFLADRPSCRDHVPQDDQLCSTRSEMVTQKAGGSTTEPASPLGAEYGPLDQIVCEGGGEGGGASWLMVTSVSVHAELHHARHVARPCGGEVESVELM